MGEVRVPLQWGAKEADVSAATAEQAAARATTEDSQGRAARRGRGHAGRIWRGEENAGDPSAASFAQIRAGGSIKFVGARNGSGRRVQGARCHPAPADGYSSKFSSFGFSCKPRWRKSRRRLEKICEGPRNHFLVIVAAVGGAVGGYCMLAPRQQCHPPLSEKAPQRLQSGISSIIATRAVHRFGRLRPRKIAKAKITFRSTMTSHRPRRRSERLGLHRPVLSGFCTTGTQWACGHISGSQERFDGDGLHPGLRRR